MVYGKSPVPARSVKTVDVDKEERSRFCLSMRKSPNLSRQHWDHRENTYGRPMISSGPRIGDEQPSSYIVRPVRDSPKAAINVNL